MPQQAIDVDTTQPAQMTTAANSHMQLQHHSTISASASSANDDDTSSDIFEESPHQNQPNSAIDEFSKYISNSPNRMDELKDYGMDLDIGISNIKRIYSQLQRSVNEANGNKSSVINDDIIQLANKIKDHVKNTLHPYPHDKRVNFVAAAQTVNNNSAPSGPYLEMNQLIPPLQRQNRQMFTAS
ncbi:hypothetical protein GQ42DRAFT_153658 [Ramicandelaber brevisporus]|nr:hypothetical protein GQ42DRAFT_153658 [Ramicandelaber brevisporus]